jgi:hypothetical protein
LSGKPEPQPRERQQPRMTEYIQFQSAFNAQQNGAEYPNLNCVECDVRRPPGPARLGHTPVLSCPRQRDRSKQVQQRRQPGPCNGNLVYALARVHTWGIAQHFQKIHEAFAREKLSSRRRAIPVTPRFAGPISRIVCRLDSVRGEAILPPTGPGQAARTRWWRASPGSMRKS